MDKIPKTTPILEQGFFYKGNTYFSYNNLSPIDSALYPLTPPQMLFILSVIALFILGIILNWHATITLLVAFLTFLYFCDMVFNAYLIYRSFTKLPEIAIDDNDLKSYELRGWPSYTIFCPLYREWEVLPQFVTAISRLDYPKDKLQVLLLLEEDDLETISKAQSFNLPDYFQILVVPHCYPKTKPKACNYGLIHSKGEYVVIYDAEDIPDPLQLKKAVAAFDRVDSKTICIQAKLNFYNPDQNILTKIFTAEYCLWFDLVLTGLQSIKTVIPLGGTSNHFRAKDLLKLNGWDAFNVTEDCDLGVRLVKNGYHTAVMDSLTLEEANSDLINWFKQRTRWVKGYIQTYLVNMRSPGNLFKGWQENHLLSFQVIVGGKVLAIFINPLMWVITLSYFTLPYAVGEAIRSFYPAPVLYLGVISLIFGNFMYCYYYMMGCAKRGYFELIKYVFLVPWYWIGMSVASWRAMYDLVINPFYWAKTKHGLHLNNQQAVYQSTQVIGQQLVDQRLVAAAEVI